MRVNRRSISQRVLARIDLDNQREREAKAVAEKGCYTPPPVPVRVDTRTAQEVARAAQAALRGEPA